MDNLDINPRDTLGTLVQEGKITVIQMFKLLQLGKKLTFKEIQKAIKENKK